MTWNLRMVEVGGLESPGDKYIEICEVYYDQLGHPMGYCDATMGGENAEDIKTYLMWALEALDKPVLSFDLNTLKNAH